MLPLSSRPLGFGRNSLPTPTQVKFDLRVLKFFKVGEHGKLDSVTESFNVLNHIKCRQSQPVLWRGEFPDSSLREGEQSGHSEAIAVLD